MTVKMKKQIKKVVKKIVKKEKCNCCCGRMPSNKSKESKVAKLKKLAAKNKGKKPEKKGLFSWFKK